MIDSHCHLNYIEKIGTTAELVQEALDGGVHTIINIGTDLKSCNESIALAEQFDSIFATVGVHPHDAKTVDDALLTQLKEFTAHKKVVAVGEIGLDYYRDLSPRDIQKKVFRQQLELAVETKLPIVIHTRESFDDTLEIVKDYAFDLPGGVFHCFPGDIKQAETVIDLGFVISVGGVITYKNASMADVAAYAPLDKIILETDAPYLTPTPYRGKTNRPLYVKYVYEHLATLKKISVSEVEKQVDRNVQKLFKLVETFGD
ncbi:MAG: TatD family deoxyribonuclease [Calditrichaeota bacterium]|nr:MAG: TatD family deoxyribonuclease [Calditrichota bacterium]